MFPTGHLVVKSLRKNGHSSFIHCWENFMSQNTFHWFTIFPESPSYIPHMINLKYWLIDALPANSLSSCVRKVAEARSAGSMLAATIAIRTVAIPSRIWQCQVAFFVLEEGTDKNPPPTWETTHPFHLDYCWSKKTLGIGIREPIVWYKMFVCLPPKAPDNEAYCSLRYDFWNEF